VTAVDEQIAPISALRTIRVFTAPVRSAGGPKTHTRRPGGGRLVADGGWGNQCATRLLQDYFLVCFRNISSRACTGLS